MTYHPATVSAPGGAPARRASASPFGWQAFAVAPPGLAEAPLCLQWRAGAETAAAREARLRVTVALDEREEKRVEVVLARLRRPVGVLDIRYASFLQPFEAALRPADALSALRDGVFLRMTRARSRCICWGRRAETPSPSRSRHTCCCRRRAPSVTRSRVLRAPVLAVQHPTVRVDRGRVLDGLLQLDRAGIGGGRAGETLLRHLRLFSRLTSTSITRKAR